MSSELLVTQQNIERFQTRLRGIKLQLASFRRTKLTEIVERRIIDQIKREMKENNYPEDVISSTMIQEVIISRGGFYSIVIKSEVFRQGKSYDITAGLELGTRGHFVFPRTKLALHWIDPETGEDRFSTGHFVSGIVGLDIIGRTMEEEADNVEKEFNAEEKRWINENLRMK